MKQHFNYSNHDVAIVHNENESEAVLTRGFLCPVLEINNLTIGKGGLKMFEKVFNPNLKLELDYKLNIHRCSERGFKNINIFFHKLCREAEKTL